VTITLTNAILQKINFEFEVLAASIWFLTMQINTFKFCLFGLDTCRVNRLALDFQKILLNAKMLRRLNNIA